MIADRWFWKPSPPALRHSCRLWFALLLLRRKVSKLCIRSVKVGGRHDVGLLAEEVGEVVPEVLPYEEIGVDTKDAGYACLTAVLVEAVKEQQGQIRDQQAQIRQLQEEVERLKACVMC